MTGPLGAIGRLFRAIGFLFTGNIDAFSNTLRRNPYAVQATFEDILKEKSSSIKQMMSAMALQMGRNEQQKLKLKEQGEKLAKTQRLKQGAAAKAKKIVAQLRDSGLNDEQIKANPEYLAAQAQFSDFTSSEGSINEYIAELEGDIKERGEKIEGNKIKLQHMKRDYDKIKGEAGDTVADMISAQEEAEINRVFAGIEQDGSGAELQRMRELRHQVLAEAKISSELAGTDTLVQEAELLHYARNSEGTKEFEELVGLSSSQTEEAPVPVPEDSAKLPE